MTCFLKMVFHSYNYERYETRESIANQDASLKLDYNKLLNYSKENHPELWLVINVMLLDSNLHAI